MFTRRTSLKRGAAQPGVVARPGPGEEADFGDDSAVGLPNRRQFERLAFVSEDSWAKKREVFFEKCPVQFQGGVLFEQLQQFGLLGLGDPGFAGVLAGLEQVYPRSQSGFVDTEHTCDGYNRPTGVDHQLYGLVFEVRSELPGVCFP